MKKILSTLLFIGFSIGIANAAQTQSSQPMSMNSTTGNNHQMNGCGCSGTTGNNHQMNGCSGMMGNSNN